MSYIVYRKKVKNKLIKLLLQAWAKRYQISKSYPSVYSIEKLVYSKEK